MVGLQLAVSISFFYATAFILQVPIVSLWPSLVAAFLALVACGAFANIINDVTDREDDLAAGKPNRLTGKPPGVLSRLPRYRSWSGSSLHSCGKPIGSCSPRI